MKILVTGGAGFIGSNLTGKLLDNEHSVVVVDNLQSGYLKNLEEFKSNPNFTFIKADVNDYEEFSPVFYRNDFDYVYHYAACVGVERTLNNPLSVLSDIEGIKNVLNLCKATCVKRVFYSSSSEVYGEPVQIPQNEETTPLNSRLPYAVIKNVGEVFIKTYSREFDLPYTIFRFFNTYGPKQSPNFVISKFISQALNNQDLTIYGDGTQTRTFMFVSDNASATVNAINSKEAINMTINIGGTNEIKIVDLAETIINVANSTSKVKHLPPLKEGDMTRRSPDTSLMKSILNIDKTVSFEEGLRKTVEYFTQL